MLLGINSKQMTAEDMLHSLQDYITGVVAIKLQQDGSTNYLFEVSDSIKQHVSVTIDEESFIGTIYILEDTYGN